MEGHTPYPTIYILLYKMQSNTTYCLGIYTYRQKHRDMNCKDDRSGITWVRRLRALSGPSLGWLCGHLHRNSASFSCCHRNSVHPFLSHLSCKMLSAVAFLTTGHVGPWSTSQSVSKNPHPNLNAGLPPVKNCFSQYPPKGENMVIS